MHHSDGPLARVDRLVTAGVDIGMRAVKVALLAHGPATECARVLASEIVTLTRRRDGGEAQLAVREGWWRALRSAGLVSGDIALVASTGQERAVLAHVGHFYRSAGLTAGVRFLFPDAVAVLDIGARQIRCTRFETPVRERGHAATPRGEGWGSDLALWSKDGSVSEVLRVAACGALAVRASELVSALAADGPTAIVGALARDSTFFDILAQRLSDDHPKAVLLSSSDAVFARAYGAALLAARRFRRATSTQRLRSHLPALPPPPSSGRSILN